MAGDALELRREFDRGFARAPADVRGEAVALLIRIADELHAVERADIAAMYVDIRVIPVPATARELLGIAHIRTALVPIYDLAAMIGRAGPAAPRWLVLSAAQPIGFAFDAFECQAAVTRASVGGEVVGGIRGRIWIGEQSYPRVDLASLADSVLQRWKER